MPGLRVQRILPVTLTQWQTQYAAWKVDNTLPNLNQYALRCQLNAIKREQFPWMLEVPRRSWLSETIRSDLPLSGCGLPGTLAV